MALYRKYRPQTFADVVGQHHVKVTIQSQIESGQVAHAYLFCGPRAIGKTTTARLLAKAVNCLNRTDGASEPCNDCDSCRDIMESRSLDIVEIDAASHTGVDNVRENVIAASFVPAHNGHKVFIIDEVHMLSTSAFNALLKTLEEPPRNTVFILCTTELAKVPATIVSRCQRFDFKKVPLPDVVGKLEHVVSQEGRSVDKAVLEAVARHSDGCLRDAESLLGQVLALDESGQVSMERASLVVPRSDLLAAAELADRLIARQASEAVTIVNDALETGVDLASMNRDLVEYLRRLLLARVGFSLESIAADLGEELAKRVVATAKQADPARLTELIEEFVRRGRELRSAEIAQLPLELGIVRACASPQQSRQHSPSPSGPAQSAAASPVKKSDATSVPDKPGAEVEMKSRAKPASAPTLKQVRQGWDGLISALAQETPSLASVLRVSEPLDVSDGALRIAIPYSFHADVLAEPRHKQALDAALERVLGSAPSIEAEVRQGMGVKGKPADDSVSVLDAFSDELAEGAAA